MGVCSLILLGAASIGTDPSADFDEVVRSNRAARQAIHSLHAKLTFEYPPDPHKTLVADLCFKSAEYWRRGNVVRAVERYAHDVDDYLIRDGSQTLLARHAEKNGAFMAAGVVRVESYPLVDLWHWSIFSNRDESLDEHLMKHRSGARTSIVDFDGTRCTLVAFPDSNVTFQIWFDPRANNLARKRVKEWSDGTQQIDEVLAFHEYAPGIFFPQKIRQTYDPKPKGNVGIWVAILDDVQVNQPIAESAFRQTFPRGTIVANELRGVTYAVDEGGQQIGPAKPLRSAAPQLAESPRQTQTSPEAVSRGLPVWIPVAVISACLIGAGFWLRKRDGRAIRGS